MKQHFYIFQLNAEDAAKINASPDEPHIHDYEELILGIEGKMEHFIDFKSVSFNAPFISFVTKGKLHRLVPKTVDGKCNMWVIRFKSEFIAETTFQLYSHYHDNANIPMKPDMCFARLTTLCEMMDAEAKQPIPDYAVVRHLLSALFIMIESERKKQAPDETGMQKTQNITFKSFLSILEENYKRPVGVEFYAEKLFMSTRNLNIICHNILQKSVTEIIETRKLIEAKQLLVYSEKTISEIGFELGYQEKSHFSTVFKKRSGVTPTEFRQEMRKELKVMG